MQINMIFHFDNEGLSPDFLNWLAQPPHLFRLGHIR